MHTLIILNNKENSNSKFKNKENNIFKYEPLLLNTIAVIIEFH